MRKYVILLAALVLAACAKTEVEAPVVKENPSEKVWTVSVEATKVDAADATKAAEADGWDGDRLLLEHDGLCGGVSNRQ